MLLYDGDDCYEVDESEVEEDESGEGCWVCFDEDYVDEFFEYCDSDEE